METSLKGTPQKGLIAATWGFFMGFAALAIYGPLAKHMKDVLGLSGFMLGLLVSIPQLTGSLLRIPFGAYADSSGSKKPFMILLSISAMGIGGLVIVYWFFQPLQDDFFLLPILLFLGILCGFGSASFSVGVAQTSYWFPQSKQGHALGLYAGIGNLAPGLFIFIIPVLFDSLGFVGTYLVWLIILIAGIIIYALIAHDAYYFQLIHQGMPKDEAANTARKLGQELIPSSSFVKSLASSARIRKTWILVFLYFTSFGGFLALSSWLPAYWGIYYQQSIVSSGIITAFGFSLLSPIIRAWTGAYCDRWGENKIAMTGYLIMTIGTFLLAISDFFELSLLGIVITAIGMGMANAAVLKMVPKQIPHSVGGAAGWIGGIGAFGGLVFPPIFGIFIDLFGNSGFPYGFYILLLFCVTASIIVFLLSKTSKYTQVSTS